MNSYETINKELNKALLSGDLDKVAKMVAEKGKTEKRLVDALLLPQKEQIIINTKECTCVHNGKSPCEAACLFDAIKRDENNNIIVSGNCTGCGECLKACKEDALAGKKDSLAVLQLLKDRTTPVYAMIAPAFNGQYSDEVTPGKLRSAFKHMGFYGMLEVALFADILTLKEALEFDRYINDDKAFMLTSCCCPLWVAMIKRTYKDLVPHVPPSVSPMVACGRTIKRIHPNAKTVFIGPCLAKKAEAREKDIQDAVDYVLNFQEIKELFDILNINPIDFPEDERDHSSKAGRIYARAHGVSEAVQATVARLCPDRTIPLRSKTADGVPACKELLKNLAEGNIDANFIEGMGCVGGCVGGPRAIINKEIARDAVNRYGEEATIKTPADNPYVLDLLHRLGYDTVESLLERDNDFTRMLT